MTNQNPHNTMPEAPFEPHFSRRVASSPGAGGPGERAALSLMIGLPDPALFPYEQVAQATARAMADPAEGPTALQYGSAQGLPSLISLLSEKFARDEDLSLQPANMAITSGASGAIGLVARTFLDEGDAVVVEAPSFPGAINIFRRTGAQIFGAPTGHSGIDIAGTAALLDSLHSRGIQPRLLYTMPTFHNPNGSTLTQAQREDLLGMARRYDLVVLEDDAYRDLYYDAASGPLPPSLYALDNDNRVVRAGTFSKILAPGMRLGWAISSPLIISRLLMQKEEGATSPFAQQVAYEFGKDGGLSSYIDLLVEAYRSKRDAMLEALSMHFPSEATWTRPAGGFFVWVTLPDSVDPTRLRALAYEEGVDYMVGERCFSDSGLAAGTHLRLSFSLLSLDEIEEAVKRLGRAVRSLL